MQPERAIDDLRFLFEEEIEIQDAEKKKSEAELKKLRADYRSTFLSCPEGKRVLADLLTECGVFETSFTKYSALTFFNEGKTAIGLQLLDYCFNINDREKSESEN